MSSSLTPTGSTTFLRFPTTSPTVLAVEKLAGIEIPERAQYIRVLVCEMARIASHLVAAGSMAMDVGALTVLLWAFREREKILDIYDVLCGARFTTSYARIGGLQQDWTPATAMLRRFLEEFRGDSSKLRTSWGPTGSSSTGARTSASFPAKMPSDSG